MLNIRFIDSIRAIPADQWQTLLASRYPFLQHAFLQALEDSGCVAAESGWQPHHLLVYEQDTLIAAAPLYLKSHSWGEYIFDWAWADAFQRAGRAYYPKLVCAVPFTPATGPRLLGEVSTQQRVAIQHLLEQTCEREQISSLHWLFSDSANAHKLAPRWPMRETVQFHWFNENFGTFNDFLQTFNARKRKSLLRERRRVAEQGITLSRKTGANITEHDWQVFYRCYHTTYLKHSGQGGYLNFPFFLALGQCLSEQLMMVTATHEGRTVAASLCFFDDQHLYGRYWGCVEEFECLHFEACYYQGIEFAIEKGLAHFDPGAQGEHKIQRGFRPIRVFSNHWIKDEDARKAIGRVIDQERAQTQQYLEAASTYLPFKQ